jgi:hypothetical protein
MLDDSALAPPEFKAIILVLPQTKKRRVAEREKRDLCLGAHDREAAALAAQACTALRVAAGVALHVQTKTQEAQSGSQKERAEHRNVCQTHRSDIIP